MDDEDASNPAATASLVLGIVVWVFYGLGLCLGVLPVLGRIATLVLFPLELLASIAALGSGVYGLVRANATGVGRASAVVGILTTLAWYAFLAAMLALALLAMGFAAASGNP